MKPAHEEAPTEDVGFDGGVSSILLLLLLLSFSDVLAREQGDIRLPRFFLELYDDIGVTDAPISDSELRHDDDDDEVDDEHDAVDRYLFIADCFCTLLPLLVAILDALDHAVLVPSANVTQPTSASPTMVLTVSLGCYWQQVLIWWTDETPVSFETLGTPLRHFETP